ncbi:MAG: HpcH/HpaI aldolase/citrate lyase family protein [Actinomycetes bacterium]
MTTDVTTETFAPAASRRPRRSCLAVPGSSDRMIEKSRSLPTDMLFLDLEDAVAPEAKASARSAVVAALKVGGWGERLVAVRVNGLDTPWAYRDVIDVVEQAGEGLDVLVLPKVQHREHVVWLDLLLTQVERAGGLPVGRIGIDAQIEDATGLQHVDQIAAASPRLTALVFGPGDFMASLGMTSPTIGEQPEGYPGDAFHYVLTRILVAARAAGVAAVDGPYVDIAHADGFARSAGRAAALGYDGKWVIHPSQIAACNAAFTPSQVAVERARRVLAAYGEATSAAGGSRGAIAVDGEMVDEASRKLAERILSRVGEPGVTGRDRGKGWSTRDM